MNSCLEFFHKSKPYLVLIFGQLISGLMIILAKHVLNHGMNTQVLVVYRMGSATIIFAPFAYFLERNLRPKMTCAIFLKIVLISVFEPLIDQNMYYLGLKYTTPTFASAMSNLLPAITFLLAVIFGLEKVNIRKVNSQVKVVGTLIAIGGAMVLAFYQGPIVQFPWIKRSDNFNPIPNTQISTKNQLIGSVMILIACFSWASYIIINAMLLKLYPAPLSVTTMLCMMGTIETTIVAFIMERDNITIWSLGFDARLLAVCFGGLVTGLLFYLGGWAVKERGPVFVTSFGPLGMIIVTIFGSIFLSEIIHFGKLIGGGVIIIGIYIVLWGKSKDEVVNRNEDKLPQSLNNETSTTIDLVVTDATELKRVNSSI